MPADVVEMIKTDHREVERLFELLRTKAELRALYLPVVSSLLIAHSRAEEAEVYPVARSEAGETEDVAHSQQEHAEAEQLLGELMQAGPDSPKFDQLLQQVVEAVNHHVQEEEQNVLPGMSERLSDARRAELAEAFATARMEHLGERPGQATKEELVQQAQNVGLSGVASKSKEEIQQAVQEQAQQAAD